MHIIVTADAQSITRIFQYCDQHDITLYYGQVDHVLMDMCWQIITESSARIDILLLLFPDNLTVIG
jgi:hypothetical protein